jgi:hypothetical protein
MKDLKDYLTIGDYIRVAIAAIPMWFMVTLMLTMILNPNTDLAVTLGVLLTPLALYGTLKLKANNRKKNYTMIWKAKEDLEKRNETEKLN